MRVRFPAVAAVLAAATIVGVGAAAERQHNFPFQPGSRLETHVGVGEVRIIAEGSASEIRVRLNIRRGGSRGDQALRDIQVKFRPGRSARLDIETPEGSRSVFNDIAIEAEIIVPRETHLRAELGVGNLRITGVQGDLDAHVGVGDLRVEVPDPAEYRSVHAEAGVGSVQHPFRSGRSRGWLGRSFSGGSPRGKYRLEAKVGVGDLKISEVRVL